MTDSCDDLASSWWKGAVDVAVPLSHGGGEGLGLSPFCFHGGLRATIPRKSPSCTFVFSRFLLAAASLRHHYLDQLDRWFVHHFLISRPAICHSDALAEISLHISLLLFYATSLPHKGYLLSLGSLRTTMELPKSKLLSKAHQSTCRPVRQPQSLRLANPDASSKK
jgi:hypothetical protein